jgi:uncharacterized peroxidase-related enzyme
MDKPISRFPVPKLEELPHDIRVRILEVQEKAGFIPNVFVTLAHRPDEFRAFFAYHDALMLKEGGGLSKADREMIVVATSGANDCHYCVVAHGALLRIYDKNPIIADQVAINYRKADLTPRRSAMLDFAVKVALQAHEIDESDFARLREHDFTDEDGHLDEFKDDRTLVCRLVRPAAPSAVLRAVHIRHLPPAITTHNRQAERPRSIIRTVGVRSAPVVVAGQFRDTAFVAEMGHRGRTAWVERRDLPAVGEWTGAKTSDAWRARIGPVSVNAGETEFAACAGRQIGKEEPRVDAGALSGHRCSGGQAYVRTTQAGAAAVPAHSANGRHPARAPQPQVQVKPTSPQALPLVGMAVGHVVLSGGMHSWLLVGVPGAHEKTMQIAPISAGRVHRSRVTELRLGGPERPR